MSKITVDLIDHMGDDLRVANAARVSFAKESDYICCRTGDRIKGCWSEDAPCSGPVLSDKDTKLIHYLAAHGHWSPFSHCFLTFRIKAPIFVARQLQKHQVGLSWNEVSRRYVDSEPEFYVPEGWRKRAENVKQGSSDETVNDPLLEWYFGDAQSSAKYVYNILLSKGVCPEQARMVLPQSMMTEWYWSGSLYAFARVCKLRLDPHAQKETREVAQWIAEHSIKLFPVSWPALMNND
jgi:thymidylate synthase (FAD)